MDDAICRILRAQHADPPIGLPERDLIESFEEVDRITPLGALLYSGV